MKATWLELKKSYCISLDLKVLHGVYIASVLVESMNVWVLCLSDFLVLSYEKKGYLYENTYYNGSIALHYTSFNRLSNC